MKKKYTKKGNRKQNKDQGHEKPTLEQEAQVEQTTLDDKRGPLL
jgi:hypothetical protein